MKAGPIKQGNSSKDSDFEFQKINKNERIIREIKNGLNKDEKEYFKEEELEQFI